MTTTAPRGTDRSEPSRYLTGHFAPVSDEIDADGLEVTGAIPPELNGAFLRNGPNPQFGPAVAYHPFDGDGMLHGMWLEKGTARYRNRWIVSPQLAAERKAGRALYGGMLEFVIPDRADVGDAGAIKNTANTNVVRHGGRIYCTLEVAKPILVDPELNTIGEFDFDGRLVGPMTAHPRLDPRTGEMHFFGYDFNEPYLRYHVVDPAGTLTRSVDVPLPDPVMIHDFLITDTHVIFLDAPAVLDIAGYLEGGQMVNWRPERGTRFGVMPRGGETDDVRWFDTDPGFIFHFLNGWTDGDVVTCHASLLDRLTIGAEHGGETGSVELEVRGRMTEFRIDLSSGTVTSRRLDERAGDFCRVADDVIGVRNRFGYMASYSSGPGTTPDFDSVTKFDLDRDTSITREFGERYVFGEPVFAADPGARDEDDGWLLSYLHDRAENRSDLVILDAKDLSDVARVRTPQRVPFGFHGNWMPDLT